MSFITQIQEAEDKAKKIVADAEKQAKDLVAIARVDGEKVSGEAMEKTVATAQEKLEQAKEKASKVYSQALSGFSSDIQSVESNTGTKKSAVVDSCVAFLRKELTS